MRVMRVGDGYELSLHVKLPRELTLAEAHDVIERLEAAVTRRCRRSRRVHTHIEPLAAHRLGVRAAARRRPRTERAAIEEAVRGITGRAAG